MLGEIHALKVKIGFPTPQTKGLVTSVVDLSGGDLSGNPVPVLSYTFIIYGVFVEGEFPNWYWCDENAQTETPPVLAEAYDGTTALRDGLAVVVSGTFYQ